MNSFQFQAVQLLNLTPEDQPSCKIENHQLTVSATRNGDQIVITVPLSQANQELRLPSTTPQVHIKAPAKPQLRSKKPRRAINRTYSCGENHFKAKLTEQDVREMRELFADQDYRQTFNSSYEVYLDLAKTYKIHYTTAYKIINGQSWKHVANV